MRIHFNFPFLPLSSLSVFDSYYFSASGYLLPLSKVLKYLFNIPTILDDVWGASNSIILYTSLFLLFLYSVTLSLYCKHNNTQAYYSNIMSNTCFFLKNYSNIWIHNYMLNIILLRCDHNFSEMSLKAGPILTVHKNKSLF